MWSLETSFIYVLFVFFSLAGYSILTIAGAVCFSLMVAAALKYMHAGGYILLKTSLPRTLVRNNSHI